MTGMHLPVAGDEEKREECGRARGSMANEKLTPDLDVKRFFCTNMYVFLPIAPP